MTAALLGYKLGMTRFFTEDGKNVPVTVIEAGPCMVTQIKTGETDGYDAVQIGFGSVKPRRSTMPGIGHDHKAGSAPLRCHREYRCSDGDVELGDRIDVSRFEGVPFVDVIGTSKGKGFAGVVRRWNFRGGPKTHGQSDRHRSPGSIGAGSSPGRVWPGTRMGGHYGVDRITVKGLRVVAADVEKNVVLVRGSVPGAKNGIVRIEKQGK